MMDGIERRAKVICMATHADADPDDLVLPDSALQRVAGMNLLPRWQGMPLWRLYEAAARVLTEEFEREKEQIHQSYAEKAKERG
jgi:hypothetical protein